MRLPITVACAKRIPLFSVLDAIPGIGDRRKRALFDYFTTLDAIKNADVDSLAKVPTMNKQAAEAMFFYFHSPSED